MAKTSDIWACDFETLSPTEYDKNNPPKTWVWLAAAMNIKTKEFKYFMSIEDFLIWMPVAKLIYFHNLAFDGTFIVDKLLKSGYKYSDAKKLKKGEFSTVISREAKWYQIKIKFNCGRLVEIRDSYKKLPFSLAKIAKDWKMETQKGSIDYKKFRMPNSSPEIDEIEYVESDVKILADALETQYEQGLDGVTIGSDALHFYKTNYPNNFELFPQIDNEVDSFIREAYKGGYVYLKKEGDYGKTCIYDMNSMYPYAMTLDLPYGHPVYFEGPPLPTKDYPLFVCHIYADFSLKKGKLPTIQLRKSSWHLPTDYVTATDGLEEVYLTSVDHKLFLEHYDIHDITYIDGYYFRSMSGLFDEYILYWSSIKEKNTGAIRELAKLMLNNLYGKFAKNPDVTQKMPILENDIVRLKLKKQEFGNTVYIPVGCFITANARYEMISAAQNNYHRFIYCDTDSLHLTGYKEPRNIKIHNTKLGRWKLETRSTCSRYLRPKRYMFYPEGASAAKVKCAGLPNRNKRECNWQTFKPGKIFKGKLTPASVPGGRILIETTFELKI